jgi:hypothetical protein
MHGELFTSLKLREHEMTFDLHLVLKFKKTLTLLCHVRLHVLIVMNTDCCARWLYFDGRKC